MIETLQVIIWLVYALMRLKRNYKYGVILVSLLIGNTVCFSFLFWQSAIDFTYLFVGNILVFLSIEDLQSKRLPLEILVFMMVIGTITSLNRYIDHLFTWGVCLLLLGLSMLLIYKLTRKCIGGGDWLLFISLSGLMGIEHTLFIMFIALFCGGCVAFTLLILKKATQKTWMPYVPFVWIGWWVLLWV